MTAMCETHKRPLNDCRPVPFAGINAMDMIVMGSADQMQCRPAAPPPPGPPGPPRHSHEDGSTCQWVTAALGIDRWRQVDALGNDLGPCPRNAEVQS